MRDCLTYRISNPPNTFDKNLSSDAMIQMEFIATWKIYALLAALFAALTAIFAKIGIEGIDSNLATGIRTIVILILTWGIIFATVPLSEIKSLGVTNWTFWAVLKRNYCGTYHWWSVKHTPLYVAECVFRFNEGNNAIDTADQMRCLIKGTVGRRMTYACLKAGNYPQLYEKT